MSKMHSLNIDNLVVSLIILLVGEGSKREGYAQPV